MRWLLFLLIAAVTKTNAYEVRFAKSSNGVWRNSSTIEFSSFDQNGVYVQTSTSICVPTTGVYLMNFNWCASVARQVLYLTGGYQDELNSAGDCRGGTHPRWLTSGTCVYLTSASSVSNVTMGLLDWNYTQPTMWVLGNRTLEVLSGNTYKVTPSFFSTVIPGFGITSFDGNAMLDVPIDVTLMVSSYFRTNTTATYASLIGAYSIAGSYVEYGQNSTSYSWTSATYQTFLGTLFNLIISDAAVPSYYWAGGDVTYMVSNVTNPAYISLQDFAVPSATSSGSTISLFSTQSTTVNASFYNGTITRTGWYYVATLMYIEPNSTFQEAYVLFGNTRAAYSCRNGSTLTGLMGSDLVYVTAGSSVQWLGRFSGRTSNPSEALSSFSMYSLDTTSPTTSPSRSPTRSPSRSPTRTPSKAPTFPTASPTTRSPTRLPTRFPTQNPTNAPTLPTRRPTTSAYVVGTSIAIVIPMVLVSGLIAALAIWFMPAAR